MKPREPRLKLPRYVRRKWLTSQRAWGYFFDPPTWARKAGCPVASEALGTDYTSACTRAEEVLLKQFDSWRSGGRADLVPERAPPGTFDWLAATYKSTAKYKEVSKRQQKLHDLGMSLVADYVLKDGRRFGTLVLTSIKPAVIDKLYAKILTVEEPVLNDDGSPALGEDGTAIVRRRERRAMANHAMKSCRRAWNVVHRAHDDLVPALNPFAKMGLKDKSKTTPTADYADLMAFVAAADQSGLSSLGTAAMVAWEWLQREEHIFGAFKVEHYRPKEHPKEVFIVHPKTGEEVWIPLFDDDGAPLFPELMERLDTIKRERIGGLMIVRDWKDETEGVPVPWVTRSGDLTYMRHRTKDLIRLAALRDELSFTSFRHGGMTELGDADLTDAQIRAISRHKSSRTLPRYVKSTQRQIVAGTKKRRQVRTKRADLSE